MRIPKKMHLDIVKDDFDTISFIFTYNIIYIYNNYIMLNFNRLYICKRNEKLYCSKLSGEYRALEGTS